MQDAVLNLCRVKMRDQLRLDKHRLPRRVPAVPARRSLHRRGAARRQRRRRRPAGLGPQVQGLGDRPQRLHLLHHPGPRLGADLRRARQARVEDRPGLHDAARRASRTSPTIFATIEDWLKDKTKFEAVDILRKFDIPCAPVLSMKELLHDDVAARERLDRRSAAQGARQLPHGRQPDQVLGHEARGHRLAAAGRAHRRGAGRAGLQQGQQIATLHAGQGGLKHGRVRRDAVWLAKRRRVRAPSLLEAPLTAQGAHA